MKISSLFATLFLMITSATCGLAATGTFIQLNRSYAEKTLQDWETDLQQMKKVGIDTVIVQWCSEPPIAYFDYPIEQIVYLDESYPILKTLFQANQSTKLNIYLGLQNNPYFWEQIKGRDRVLRDFFLVRVARNAFVQKHVLEQFGDDPSWKGYYIPDEIDDFTWRHENKRPVIKRYIHEMSALLKKNDPTRTVAVSAFFRGRTSPNIVAANLLDITEGSGVDILMLQDGVGVGDPPLEYLSSYYEAITTLWNQPEATAVEEESEEGSDGIPSQETVLKRPMLWGIAESFHQTSQKDEPFSATPASPESLEKQIETARTYFDSIVFFTFLDYMSPSLGTEAEALFDLLLYAEETN